MAEIRWQQAVDPESGATYEVFYPPSLRHKVERITAEQARQMIARADAQATDLAARFVDRARTRVFDMLGKFADARPERAGPPGSACDAFMAFRREGSAFNYPLISMIGDSACRMMETVGVPDKAMSEVLESHAKAIALVLSERLSGDGGAEGDVLLSALVAAVDKFAGGPDETADGQRTEPRGPVQG